MIGAPNCSRYRGGDASQSCVRSHLFDYPRHSAALIIGEYPRAVICWYNTDIYDMPSLTDDITIPARLQNLPHLKREACLAGKYDVMGSPPTFRLACLRPFGGGDERFRQSLLAGAGGLYN